MTAHPEPIYSARDQGFREALLQVLSFIAKHGKAEVDAFCAQALHDLRMDTLHWNAAKDAEIAKLRAERDGAALHATTKAGRK
jgi:hypothetical protein